MEEKIPQTSGIDHDIYKRVETPEEADALAWVFKNKRDFVPYYFKFPPLGDKEVRAKILYTGLCHSDSSTGREDWGPVKFPLCAGHEVVCEITKVGSEVKDFAVGETIAIGPFRAACHNCEFCKEGNDQLCSSLPEDVKLLYGMFFGGFCTHIQQPADKCVHLPKGVDISTFPPVLCAGVTVYSPMKRFITKKGAKLGVIGIGGLGHLAVQYGKAMGCEVTAFTTCDKKVSLIHQLGATEVIIDKDINVLKQHTMKLDYIINTIPASGFEMMEAYLATLKNGGTFIQVGLPHCKEHFEITYKTMCFKQLVIAGSLCGSLKETKETMDFHQKCGAKVIAEMFSFEDFPKALHHLEEEKPLFRGVVNVKDFVERHFPDK